VNLKEKKEEKKKKIGQNPISLLKTNTLPELCFKAPGPSLFSK